VLACNKRRSGVLACKKLSLFLTRHGDTEKEKYDTLSGSYFHFSPFYRNYIFNMQEMFKIQLSLELNPLYLS
jgi:hypothetical protein